ncbi:MAG: ribonuclease HII [Candidatus Marsarchaeota archaeon]|nr:ribonuclease HII [Candidatus Marsarchaeota archaeon]
MMIGGGDEAGRGAVIGPLVVSVICVSQGRERHLSDIGVRDSKMLTRRKREFLFDEIHDICEEVKYYPISNEEINSAMRSGVSLNQLEAIRFAQLVDSLESRVRRMYIDSPDVRAERFGVRMSLSSKTPMRVMGVKGLKKEKDRESMRIVSEHKADARYPVVSAASIISKVIRDREMERIERESGVEIGSGYPSDRYTIEAIKSNLESKRLNPYIREYWKTLEKIKQRKIKEFDGFS